MRLDKLGIGSNRFQVTEHWIKAFDVADLQNAFLFAREFNQFGGLDGVIRHGLLYEHVFAHPKQTLGESKVRGGGSDNTQRVRGSGCLLGRTKHRDAIFVTDAFCGFGGDIEDARELNLPCRRHFCIYAGVFLSQRASAQNRDFDFFDTHLLFIAQSNPDHSARTAKL